MEQLSLFGEESPEPARCNLPKHQPNPRGLSLGCCAWQHDSYRGLVYPKGTASRDELGIYAQYCNAVEVDASFYAVPPRSTVERWLGETPPHFRFAMKAPRSLTHDARLALENTQARADWEAFLALAQLMGDRLCAVLLQLGPSATAHLFPALIRVLNTVPPAVPIAVEFRHPSWNNPEISAALRDLNVVRAWSDQYLDPTRHVRVDAPHLFDASGSFRYIRLLGDMSTKYDRSTGKRVFQYGKILFDRSTDLPHWVERVREHLSRGMPVHLFINNHYQGFALETAQILRTRLSDPQ